MISIINVKHTYLSNKDNVITLVIEPLNNEIEQNLNDIYKLKLNKL